MIIWHKPKEGVYYHRLIKGAYLSQSYQVGAENSYGHVIVHRIDDFDYYKKKVPLRKKVIKSSISFLQKYL